MESQVIAGRHLLVLQQFPERQQDFLLIRNSFRLIHRFSFRDFGASFPAALRPPMIGAAFTSMVTHLMIHFSRKPPFGRSAVWTERFAE
jgi:hypothetical protein